MSWNYRIVRYPNGHLEVREVYHLEDGVGHCRATVCGDDLSELIDTWDHVGHCLGLDPIDVDDDGNVK